VTFIPLAIHRRKNLELMLGKLEESRQILAANWRLNAPPHANNTPRVAFLRYPIALLDSESAPTFLGQFKTLLTGPELPVASDVAVPWDIAYFIEFLKPKLGENSTEFITALNDHTQVSKLDEFELWKNQSPVSLETSWPED